MIIIHVTRSIIIDSMALWHGLLPREVVAPIVRCVMSVFGHILLFLDC